MKPVAKISVGCTSLSTVHLKYQCRWVTLTTSIPVNLKTCVHCTCINWTHSMPFLYACHDAGKDSSKMKCDATLLAWI